MVWNTEAVHVSHMPKAKIMLNLIPIHIYSQHDMNRFQCIVILSPKQKSMNICDQFYKVQQGITLILSSLLCVLVNTEARADCAPPGG